MGVLSVNHRFLSYCKIFYGIADQDDNYGTMIFIFILVKYLTKWLMKVSVVN